MEMRKIGALEVSLVGFGCNQFGPTLDRNATTTIVRAALDLGINFFDVADEYGPDGIAEEYLGYALRGRRSEAIIATKFGQVLQNDATKSGASARWIAQAVEDSLRRLNVDHIDLYQQHLPDPDVPHEETLAALDQLVREGKILEVGCSNMDSTMIEDRLALAAEKGFRPTASSQNRYNLLRQEAAQDLLPTLIKTGVPLLPYFPLASGMLGGRYQPDAPLPSDSRFARHLVPEHAARIIDRDGSRVAALAGWAAERGHGVADLAVAWLASQPVVASVIAGATKLEQVDKNVQASQWRLTPEELVEVTNLGRATDG